MRIIAGKWRGRLIRWPKDGTTRPMPDRVRESVFNILGSAFDTPGELPPLRVADLFAGSGSIGLEALSRGAAFCLFVEHDAEAVATLRRNLHDLEVGPEGSLLAANAWLAPLAASARTEGGPMRDGNRRSKGSAASYTRQGRPESRDARNHENPLPDGRDSESRAAQNQPMPYDLFLLDPPYASARDTTPSGPVPRLLERLADFAAPRSRIVLHHERDIVYPDHHWSNWLMDDRREYGTHAVSFYVR